MDVFLALLGLVVVPLVLGYLFVVPGLALLRTLRLGSLATRLDRLAHEGRRLRHELRPRPADVERPPAPAAGAEEVKDALPVEPPARGPETRRARPAAAAAPAGAAPRPAAGPRPRHRVVAGPA